MNHSDAGHIRLSIVKALLLVLIHLSILIIPARVTGWDCHHDTPEWWFATEDLVFEGHVINTEIIEGEESFPIARDVTFGDVRVYKGDDANIYSHTLTVRTGLFADGPGYPFICGEEYVVYASRYWGSDIYVTNVCRPTRPLRDTLPSYDELEAVIIEDRPDIPESRKEEVREKYYQPCPEWKAPPVDFEWRFQAESAVTAAPILTDKIVIFGSRDGHLCALDRESGVEMWKIKASGHVRSSPTIIDDAVYFGSTDGYFYAVDIVSGKELWKFKTQDGIGASPEVSGGLAYFGSDDGFFYAVDILSGKEKWKYKTGGRIDYPPVIHKGTVFVGSLDDYLYVLDIASGKEIWKFKTGDAVHSPKLINNTLYVLSGTFSGNHLHAIDVEKYTQLWEFDFEADVASSFFAKGTSLYFVDANGHIRVIDAGTGREQSRMNTNIYLGHSPIDDDMSIGHNGTLYIGLNTYLYAVDILTGNHKWRLRTPYGTPYFITTDKQKIYFGTWYYLNSVTVKD